jgi:hypothetical protein
MAWIEYCVMGALLGLSHGLRKQVGHGNDDEMG